MPCPFEKALRRDIGVIVALAAFVNEITADDGDSTNEAKQLAVRKISAFVSTTFGLSLKDLPPSLQAKVESYGKTEKKTFISSLESFSCFAFSYAFIFMFH